MGEAFMTNHGGGGGGSLNFSVKNYSSDAAKPTHPRNENEIITITEIKYKNYIFSPVEPRTPVEGFIWFETTMGGEFEFSVTKKNPILIGLQKCKQYTQGKWHNIIAYIGINGRWLQFSTIMEPYFYKSGIDDYDNRDFTGGWTGYASNGRADFMASADRSRLLIKAYNRGEDTGWAYTKKAIDVTGYNTLTYKVKSVYLSENYNGAKGYCQIGITDRPDGSFLDSKTITAGGTYSFNISSYKGICPLVKCYIKNDDNQRSEVVISSITME